MKQNQDLTGIVFGRLRVVEKSQVQVKYRTYWDCACDCGNSISVRSDHLLSGKTQSCKCYMKESISLRTKTHGQAGAGGIRTLEYTAWRAMLARCYNEKRDHYERYGGRGIRVCDRWKNSFENFFKDMGKKPTSRHSLERNDNDKNYCKSNCKWDIQLNQSRNKSNNRMLEHDGVKMIMSDWAEKLKVNPSTLSEHLETKTMDQIIRYYKQKRKQ